MRLGVGIAMLAGAVALASCAPDTASTDTDEAAEAVGDGALNEVLSSDLRADDKLRDAYRRPAQTLEFFQVEPDMTVIEYAPGGGWYTRVLAPYLVDSGRYVAVGFPPETFENQGEDAMQGVRDGAEGFAARIAKTTSIAEDKLAFHFSNAIPEDLVGNVDRVLIFRMMHNLKRWGVAESEVESLFKALKPGGMLGVVQHRAKADAPAAYVDGSKGYLKQDEMIAFFKGIGFELVEASEINANPKDTADYPGGVWTLPPSLSEGEKDREKYLAIGESDRMTLLFRKPG